MPVFTKESKCTEEKKYLFIFVQSRLTIPIVFGVKVSIRIF